MDLIRESVKKIQEILEHGGCGDGDVILDVNPDARNCQFEKGALCTMQRSISHLRGGLLRRS